MEDRLGVSANVFYQEWDSQQIEIREDPLDFSTSYIANAGQSTSYGAEIEVSYFATERLEVYGGLGLLHTEFEEFQIGNDDFSGLPFPSAPEQSLALGFRWGEATGWFGTGSMKVVSSSTSRLEQGLVRPETLEGYTTVDASAGYAWEQVKLTAYATNLFDEEYFEYEYGPDSLATLGDRREVGIRFDYTF